MVSTPENVIRRAATDFLAVVAEHPHDVRSGQPQLVDLAAVLAGEQAPSRARKNTARRGRMRRAAPMSLADAAANAMSYTSANPGSAVELALNELRTSVLGWTRPGYVPGPNHSAPPPSARSR